MNTMKDGTYLYILAYHLFCFYIKIFRKYIFSLLLPYHVTIKSILNILTTLTGHVRNTPFYRLSMYVLFHINIF